MPNYFTVSQYAQITGKDPGNIRKMLINGSLAGKKIGNQWVIAKDTILPVDRRISSGKYKNWRMRKKINQSHPNLLNTLAKMSSEIANIYGSDINSIFLYGSYSRNEATPESDIDVAVILYDENSKDSHDKMIDITIDYELDLGITLSVVPINYNQFHEWKDTLPFYKNIEKEGIVLWKIKK